MKKIFLPLSLLGLMGLAGCDVPEPCPSNVTCVDVTNSAYSVYSIDAMGVVNTVDYPNWNTISMPSNIEPGKTMRAQVNCGTSRQMLAVYSDATAYATSSRFFGCGEILTWAVTAH